MADPEMKAEEQEVMMLKEPMQLYPELVNIPPSKVRGDRRRGIATIIGGFIICLSFGSGKKQKKDIIDIHIDTPLLIRGVWSH